MKESKRDTAYASVSTSASAFRRDHDSWLVDAKTGTLIGPDPHIERELTDEELARVRTMGRPPLPENQRRMQVTMRWARETIEDLKALGPGWTNFAERAVKRALSNQRRVTPKKRGPKPDAKVTPRHPKP
jgi:uncharacterized protein (DUF4415 family)